MRMRMLAVSALVALLDALPLGAAPRSASLPASAASLPASAGVVPEAKPPLQLLTSTPEAMRTRFGWTYDERLRKQDRALGIWQALRKGMDVLAPAADQQLARPEHLEKHVPPRLRRELLPACEPLLAATCVSEAQSRDGTVKLLLELADGLTVECVIIPISGKHTSLCVSSQVGCSRACAFCSTGTMGLVRSLATEEILSQVWLALRLVRERGLPPLINIVFMGMGEQLRQFIQP